jgi:hypothetical protein
MKRVLLAMAAAMLGGMGASALDAQAAGQAGVGATTERPLPPRSVPPRSVPPRSVQPRSVQPRPLSARERRARQDSARLSTTLDIWIVQRYRGAQLLPDTVTTTGSLAADALWPRIESMHAGGRNDTLFALHFSAHPGEPALGRRGPVRLAGPTGSMSPVGATVLSRRPFRAPRTPKANSADERDWRYGWAYVAALPRAGRTAPATTFRGWLLIDAGTPK